MFHDEDSETEDVSPRTSAIQSDLEAEGLEKEDDDEIIEVVATESAVPTTIPAMESAESTVP